MINVSHLSKSYGTVKAVDDLSFEVKKGEIVGFLGPNGAGKSTTLRILAGFVGATSGEVRIAGHDVNREPLEARAALGYMPELSPLYTEMRVREYLGFRAELKLVPRRARKAAVARALEQARVTDMSDVVIGHLSKGYRQRVGLADALVGSPPLLILDEPTAGLDPNQIREVRALVKGLAEEHTVLLSTHILSEVEAMCGRALVIARGKLVAEGSIESLRALRPSSGVRLIVRGEAERAMSIARKVPGVRTAKNVSEPADALVTLSIVFGLSAKKKKQGASEEELGDDGARVEAVVSRLVSEGIGVREVAPQKATLEQVFSELTVASVDAAPAPEPEPASEREPEQERPSELS